MDAPTEIRLKQAKLGAKPKRTLISLPESWYDELNRRRQSDKVSMNAQILEALEAHYDLPPAV